MEAHQVGADLLWRIRKGAIAGGDEFADSYNVFEDGGGCEGDVVVVGGVDVDDAAGVEVGFAELEVFDAQQIGGVVAPVKSRVLEDEVEFLIRMAQEPAAAVVDVDGAFGIGQQRGGVGVVGDQF